MSLGIDLPNLRRAADFSGRALSQIQDALREDVPPEDECLDIIVFGSLARYEATGSSDLDYVVAVHRLPEDVRRTRKLLNDVLRYWRTIAVDYQAKRWGSLKEDWGLRYIKLLISRKLAFAGTLASVLRTKSATVDYYMEHFGMPALARLAQLEPELSDGQKPALRQILTIADEFVGLLAQQSFREEAKAVEDPDAVSAESDFGRMRAKAMELQEALEAVFFEDDLASRSIRYLSF